MVAYHVVNYYKSHPEDLICKPDKSKKKEKKEKTTKKSEVSKKSETDPDKMEGAEEELPNQDFPDKLELNQEKEVPIALNDKLSKLGISLKGHPKH